MATTLHPSTLAQFLKISLFAKKIRSSSTQINIDCYVVSITLSDGAFLPSFSLAGQFENMLLLFLDIVSFLDIYFFVISTRLS